MTAPALGSACPLPLSAFPPALQKSLDPTGPLPARMMAAKGILLAGPRDFLTALFALTFDPDPTVALTARQSAPKTQDKVLTGLRDDELHPLVLDFFAQALAGQETYLELIALNPAAADGTMARLAATGSDRIVEIVAQNQLRILRDERIVRALVQNPATRPATRDSVLDFCVRSGLWLADLPELALARRRLLGDDPAEAQKLAEAEANSAERVLQEFGPRLTDDDGQVEEAQRLTFTQRVLKMSVSQKIKLATLGNKEARSLLLRDSNKLVALAAVQSPRITDGEIAALANSRTLHEELMRFITHNREWLKNYQVKVSLVNNPKTPLAVALKLLPHLHGNDVKTVARNRNIPSAVQTQARKLVMTKEH